MSSLTVFLLLDIIRKTPKELKGRTLPAMEKGRVIVTFLSPYPSNELTIQTNLQKVFFG